MDKDVEHFDTIVVGGGPAGSVAATLIAQDGHRVLLMDKETHPRHQIGESLLPSTIHGICRLVDLDLSSAGFPIKRGGTFRWGANPQPWTFAFETSAEMGAETGYAYQVERRLFDHMLLNNATRHGVEVRQRHRVTSVLKDGERISGVSYLDADGTTRHATATFVINASGHTGRLHTAVGGKREHSPYFRHLAVYGYFAGGKRLPEPNSGNIMSVAFPGGWFWYIPLRPDLTSVGAVVPVDTADRVQGDPEHALRSLIGECPLVKEFLGDTPLSSEPPYDQLRVRRDWSYAHTTFWSPGMMLIGDAACFIDPLFSQGVHLATYGALLAARSVNSVLAGQVSEADAAEEFQARYRSEFRLFHDFLIAFYRTEEEDSYFWRAKQITGGKGSDAEAFVNLVGGLASGEFQLDDLFAQGRCSIRPDLAESTAALAAAQANVDDEGHIVGLHHVPIVEETLSQAVRLRVGGGEGASDAPRIPGGLIASPDGRRWQRTS